MGGDLAIFSERSFDLFEGRLGDFLLECAEIVSVDFVFKVVANEF